MTRPLTDTDMLIRAYRVLEDAYPCMSPAFCTGQDVKPVHMRTCMICREHYYLKKYMHRRGYLDE